MNILAFDTSNLPMGIAIVNEEKVLGEITTNVNRNHSIRLMPALESLLKDVEISLQEIDLIVVAQGPGSYTGVRIGVTTAKTIAWAINKPLVGISSLQIFAHQIPYFKGILVPIFDARRGQVYTGGYKWKAGKLQEVLSEQIILLENLLPLLQEKGEQVLFLGDDVEKHRKLIEERLAGQAEILGPEYQIPRASHLARLGLLQFQAGKLEDLSFVPQYLQRTEAEVRLERKKGERA